MELGVGTRERTLRTGSLMMVNRRAYMPLVTVGEFILCLMLVSSAIPSRLQLLFPLDSIWLLFSSNYSQFFLSCASWSSTCVLLAS